MELFSKRFKKKPPLESEFFVTDDGSSISVVYPDGNEQSIEWKGLILVEVQTYDSLGMDVWFVLKSNSHEISFPLGASGYENVVEGLEKLPGFEMKGMNSTSNETFTCWEHANAL